ncbi:hypothetical protein CHARACLAT_009951 [Characodon lateralis]|uniref:Uncharacterized protein n=1 Tax=Characodon lateralis TaxID=208331 RepID=A0ABU7CZR9_9TELE|nr:hypothetical protein [Characodon lateralis]
MSDTWGVNADSEGEPADLDNRPGDRWPFSYSPTASSWTSTVLKLAIRCPEGERGGRSALFLRFMNWKLQTVLLKQRIILKGTNVFLNKHLKTLLSPENYGS